MPHPLPERRRDVFVVVAHQDDWQLFMAPDVYARLRDPHARVVFVVATAGEGRHGEHHWRARLNGCVLAITRALPSWNPYLAGESALPTACSVSYARERVNERDALVCTINDDARAEPIRLYLLHAHDGGAQGVGLPPHHESLTRLREEGRALGVAWPPHAPHYESWDAFVATLEAIVEREHDAGAPAELLAADPDPERNPGDHADHREIGRALQAILARRPFLEPTWYAMYANEHRPENLDPEAEADQRAAVFAYLGGYGATASGLTAEWRIGTEREYAIFGKRQYRVKNP